MSQGRITCARCGSNNFDTVTACWKCSAPLTGGVASAAQQSAARPNVTAYAAPAAQPMMAPAMAGPSYGERATANVVQTVSNLGNMAASNRAAFWLGMLFPYFGLPIGLAFIMCDDRRRQEVGRLCVMWSLLSSVIHVIFMVVSLLGMRQMLAAFIGSAVNAAKSGGGGMSGGGLGGDSPGGMGL